MSMHIRPSTNIVTPRNNLDDTNQVDILPPARRRSSVSSAPPRQRLHPSSTPTALHCSRDASVPSTRHQQFTLSAFLTRSRSTDSNPPSLFVVRRFSIAQTNAIAINSTAEGNRRKGLAPHSPQSLVVSPPLPLTLSLSLCDDYANIMSGPWSANGSDTVGDVVDSGKIDIGSVHTDVLSDPRHKEYHYNPQSPQLQPVTAPQSSTTAYGNRISSARVQLQKPGPQTLTSARSQPVLASRPGTVKDIANRFDRKTPIDVNRQPNHEGIESHRQRRNVGPRNTRARSPMRAERGVSQRPRSGATSRSPQRPAFTSFDSSCSQSSLIGNSSFSASRPLFGEVTQDGWHGEIPPSKYSLYEKDEQERSISQASTRRQSEGSAFTNGVGNPGDAALLSPHTMKTLKHNRSRSELNGQAPQMSPSMPDLGGNQRLSRQSLSALTSSPNGTSTPPSFLPVSSNRIRSTDPSKLPSPRSSSAAPPTNSKSSRSPARQKHQVGKENTAPAHNPRNRYQPPPLHSLQSPQTLSAKIVAPLPKLSPPLRSSRPRQPVSSATTAASRARVTERFEDDGQIEKESSEHWLNQPYKPPKQSSRRRIPELDTVDFAARRARIQKAISQNLSNTESIETLNEALQRRAVSGDDDTQETNGAAINHDSQLHMPINESPQKLNVQTDLKRQHVIDEPSTANTTFEEQEDESPILGRSPQDVDTRTPSPEHLTPAVYQTSVAHIDRDLTANGTTPLRVEPSYKVPHSSSSDVETEFAEDNSARDTPSDLEGHWQFSSNAGIDQGSIKIMLDGNTASQTHGEYPDHKTGTHRDIIDEYQNMLEGTGVDPTPRASPVMHDTPRADVMPSIAMTAQTSHTASRSELEIPQVLEQYQKSGHIPSDTIRRVQDHMVDLNRLSANGGSDGFMIQNLLDSVLQIQQPVEEQLHPSRSRQLPLGIPAVTPDTPPDALLAVGTAVVFGPNEDDFQLDEVDDFEMSIKKANEEWERQHRVSEIIEVNPNDSRPPPPPKDYGYSPRESAEASGIKIPQNLANELRSSIGDKSRPPSQEIINSHAIPPSSQEMVEKQTARLGYNALPLNLPFSPIALETDLRRFSAATGISADLQEATSSSRPSVEFYATTRETLPSFPSSMSVSSLADTSTRRSSIERTSDHHSKLEQAAVPNPEQKRLFKRRHIIRELLDTEHTYHQDLTIIEDIYKATVAELISEEDKKILFGNCNEVERFSLRFYDELRRAVVSVYVPSRKAQWTQRRGSFSTTHSDATGQASTGAASSMSDAVNDDKDRATTVGQVFLNNFDVMNQAYGTYLRNHDAANQRLAALKSTPTVKCWLDECHNNASDITAAWDLDSLLVKPTQRVSKYPMLLQQLLDTTPPSHPDYDALKSAAEKSIVMLTKINDAKKRAELVDQIINRKGKEDVRTGLAKAFGRRTEKLKERVGIAEAFQDPEFDDIVQKFGGHFIRLQICMRDVQDYVHKINKAVEQINQYAASLEGYADVAPSSLPEAESKWRRYCQAVREITGVAFPDHKAAVQKRVVQPMVRCIELHKGPQNAIDQRKKRIVDYAKCKSIEKRGEKPDKKTVEASDMYVALNDHLKVELPRLYTLTANLVQNCLICFLDIQLAWFNVWERKLRPTIDAIDIPASIAHIEPAFRADFDLVKDKMAEFGLCNGSILADSTDFTMSTTTLIGDSDSSTKRPSTTFDGRSGRTSSVTSDNSPNPNYGHWKRYSSGYGSSQDLTLVSNDSRIRSNSSYSGRGSSWHTQPSSISQQPYWGGTAMASGVPSSRPLTSNNIHNLQYNSARTSSDVPRASRPSSSSIPVRLEVPDDNHRFSGMFTSALPTDVPDTQAAAVSRNAPDDMPVLFVCASLFEFSIDKTRREAGYPYLTYVRGEVFDVVAQKGELWLAKNQDDDSNCLGWIWEQHFVILSNE